MSKKKPLYKQIYEDILTSIQDGTWNIGDQLPTEKKIAEAYGVSRITSQKAIDLLAMEGYITRIAGKGSFVSNTLAQNKRQKSHETQITESKLIGLIMEDFAEAFGTMTISGIEQVLSKADYSLVLQKSNGSQEEESKAIQRMRALGVKGFLIMPVHGKNYSQEILRLSIEGIPTVLLDRELSGIPLPYVSTDHTRAAMELTEYLFSQGHRNIALIGPKSVATSSVSQRIRGFSQGHAAKGFLTEEKYLFLEMQSTLPAKSIVETLRKDVEKIESYILQHKEVTALVAVEYDIALAAWLAARNVGKTTPQDLEIVCFDSPSSAIGYYRFTHMHQNEILIGETSAKLLLDCIQGKGQAKSVLIPAKLEFSK